MNAIKLELYRSIRSTATFQVSNRSEYSDPVCNDFSVRELKWQNVLVFSEIALDGIIIFCNIGEVDRSIALEEYFLYASCRLQSSNKRTYHIYGYVNIRKYNIYDIGNITNTKSFNGVQKASAICMEIRNNCLHHKNTSCSWLTHCGPGNWLTIYRHLVMQFRELIFFMVWQAIA